MKRVGYLWDHLIGFENLLRAAETACKGKRFRPDVIRFHFSLEQRVSSGQYLARNREVRQARIREPTCPAERAGVQSPGRRPVSRRLETARPKEEHARRVW